MNAVTETSVSAQTLEHVLGTGDLAKLTPAQRVEYMTQTCKLLGLNPLTRPFRFMLLNGQITLYATRDGADQLRRVHKVNITLSDKRIEGGTFMVTAHAKLPDGREDEDMGAVAIDKLTGEWRANAMMKCITKAKRRVTLSICGLGFLDETEVETLVPQGAKTFDAEDELPKPELSRGTARQQVEAAIKNTNGAKRTSGEWLDNFANEISECQTDDEIGKLLARDDVGNAAKYYDSHPGPAKERFETIVREGMDRIALKRMDQME